MFTEGWWHHASDRAQAGVCIQRKECGVKCALPLFPFITSNGSLISSLRSSLFLRLCFFFLFSFFLSLPTRFWLHGIIHFLVHESIPHLTQKLQIMPCFDLDTLKRAKLNTRHTLAIKPSTLMITNHSSYCSLLLSMCPCHCWTSFNFCSASQIT